MTMIILPEIAPLHLRNMLPPVIGTVISMAGVLGPVLGGALAKGNWRWIFFIKYVWALSSPSIEFGLGQAK